MAAVIGALRVDLGLNSAEFSAGLKKASAGLGNFAKAAGVGLAAVATAAAAAGLALGVAVKGAIDNADQMGELAQSVGVSVEALSRLGYAAKLSGTDTDTLATGLRKLSQNMLAFAQGGAGPASSALNALGISVQNANGTLVSSDQVLIQIAEKFAGLEDGALKTALAVQLFGKSGADLIPFLNQGSAGINALTAEADRLGVTISGTTASAAGDFNDTLDRLSATFSGVVNQVAGALLPSLNQLAIKLADPQFAASAAAIGSAIVEGMKVAVDAINTVVGALSALQQGMAALGVGNNGAGYQDFNTPKEAKALITQQLQNGGGGADVNSIYSGIFPPGASAPQVIQDTEQVEGVLTELSTTMQGLTGASTASAVGTTALSTAMSEGKAVYDATRTPAEAYAQEVERLNELLRQGAIDQDTFNRAVAQAQEALDNAESSGSSLSSSLSSGLANVFTSVIDGSKSAVDAIGDLLKSLGQMLINRAFQSLIGGLFGGGGGFSIPGFASGTSFAPGGMALVGERGPELVNLPRGSQVIPNHQLGRAGMTVAPVFNINGDVDSRSMRMLDDWARMKLPSLVNQINNDPLARG